MLGQNIYPLGYSIPERKVKNVNINVKQRRFAPLIPGKSDTYIYKTEDSYNTMYEESKFGYTYKKGGWDTFRHYEILANNCVPYFLDLEKCPEQTLVRFPKKIIKEIISLEKVDKLPDELYNNYIEQLNNYTRQFLTCEKNAEYFLETLSQNKKVVMAPKILMLTFGGLNYSMCTLAYGLRKILNENFIDYPKINEIYRGGRLYNLSWLENTPIDRKNIEKKVGQHYYDFIIFGPCGPDETFNIHNHKLWDIAKNNYPYFERIFIFGGDRAFNMKVKNRLGEFLTEYTKNGLCFVRELDYSTEYYFDKSWNEYVEECRSNWNRKINLCKIQDG